MASDSCASFTGAPDWAKVAAALAEALPTLAGEGKKDFVALIAADADGSAPLEGVDVEAAKAAAEAEAALPAAPAAAAVAEGAAAEAGKPPLRTVRL